MADRRGESLAESNARRMINVTLKCRKRRRRPDFVDSETAKRRTAVMIGPVIGDCPADPGLNETSIINECPQQCRPMPGRWGAMVRNRPGRRQSQMVNGGCPARCQVNQSNNVSCCSAANPESPSRSPRAPARRGGVPKRLTGYGKDGTGTTVMVW